jgi:uncharacterized protein involved in response to NO
VLEEKRARPPLFAGVHWREEPFRALFPLAVVLGWVGIGHWLVYALGLAGSYSCLEHGLIVVQAFLATFAAGFLLTALPRRTQSPLPTRLEIATFTTLPVAMTAAAVMRRWALTELLYALLLCAFLRFGQARMSGCLARRRPPASFVLIPIGALQGISGALLLAWTVSAVGPPWSLTLGRLLAEQGVFLCFTLGAGGVILALLAGKPPPADVGSSPLETRRLLLYSGAAVGLLVTFVIEAAGGARLGPLLRAVIFVAGSCLGDGIWGLPARPGFHRRMAWIAVWMIPSGLALSGLWPQYRVPALHVMFIGGFSALVFAVATHVSLGHLGLESLMSGCPRSVILLAAGLTLALASRLAADVSHTYFAHLAWAAACWIAGSTAWLAALAPRLWRRR